MKRIDYCAYCEKVFMQLGDRRKTQEHIIPHRLTRGTVSITVPVCLQCNHFKGSELPIVFLGRLETIQKNIRRILNETSSSLKVA